MSADAGMLRVKLLESQKSSGSGSDFATALVVAEYAERAAFARQALAVKLRELDVVCDERDRLGVEANRISRECRELVDACAAHDQNLDDAIRGRLRRVP